METDHSMTVEYNGSLRTTATHLKSANNLITDAPTDNNGKGDSFSPTDLVCSALSSCMMTIMGIYADREGIDISGMSSEVTKVMASGPRRISEIKVHFSHTDIKATEHQRDMLKKVAEQCPVALSLSPTLKQTLSFDF